jgi:UDP-3-O-[3-hydroxymyristoyl] glucosamine N-acyltransferase
MGHLLNRPISAVNLAERLGLSLAGSDICISEVRPLHSLVEGSLCFAKGSPIGGIFAPAVIIAPPGTAPDLGAVIESTNPRLAFAQALQLLCSEPGFIEPDEAAIIDPSAKISPTAYLGRGVKVGARSVIGHHVVVADGVTIGDDCIIKSNTVIGEAGFGFERDEAGIPCRVMHLGSVTIGNRVEIGSLNTVCRATLGSTIVEDDVKTDDHVHIAHNCRVRRGALLTACVELSGGVDVGEFAWIGPNSSVIQKVVIGKNAYVGIGSNITKSVAEGVAVAGNPARVLSRST